MIGKRFLAVALLTLTILCLSASISTNASTASYDQADCRRITHKPVIIAPTIKFLSWGRDQSGDVFSYTVKAGSKDINSITLGSPVFKTSQLLGASENNVDYNQKFMYIRFNNKLKAGQTKVIWFDLSLNYNGFRLGYIPYYIQASSPYIGLVKGPLFSYTLPHG